MTVYTKTMMDALVEVRDLQENNMDLMKKAVSGSMQTLKMKDGKLKMDKVTASAIMQILDKVNPANKKKMEKMINDGNKSGIVKLSDFAMSKVTGFKSEETDLDEGKKESYPARQLIDPKKEVLVVKKNDVVVIDKVNQDYYLKKGWALAEETELDEAPKYELYHKDFSTAMQYAYKMAKKLHGITVKPSEIDDKVASGPKKPSEGKTNSYRLEGDKGAIQVQVYNKGGSKPYELNFYKEEVEIDEATSQVLAHGGKGQYKVVSGPAKDGSRVTVVKFKGKEISSGDYDSGADGWYMNIKGEKGQKFFDDAQKMADYFAKNKITEEADLDEAVSDVQAMKAKYTLIKVAKKGERKSQSFWNNLMRVANSGPQGTIITADDLKRVDDHSNKIQRDVRLAKKNKKEEVDPADVDDDATDDDRAAASKNIIHQLRKSIDQKGKFAVTFGDNKKVKVDVKIAQAINNKFMTIKKPADKEKFQVQIAKSYKDMLKVLKAGYNEEVELDELGNKYVMDKGDLAAVQKKLNTMKSPPKLVKDKAGYFHLKYDGGKKQVGPFNTMKDVLGSLNEEVEKETILDRIDKKLKERKNG